MDRLRRIEMREFETNKLYEPKTGKTYEGKFKVMLIEEFKSYFKFN